MYTHTHARTVVGPVELTLTEQGSDLLLTAYNYIDDTLSIRKLNVERSINSALHRGRTIFAHAVELAQGPTTLDWSKVAR